MVSLAAQAALAANVQVIRVLRLVGARDAYIAGGLRAKICLAQFDWGRVRRCAWDRRAVGFSKSSKRAKLYGGSQLFGS